MRYNINFYKLYNITKIHTNTIATSITRRGITPSLILRMTVVVSRRTRSTFLLLANVQKNL